jgi:DNA-binding response OmpR family regulator
VGSISNVLIVEDDALIALDLDAELRAAGYTVVGPAGSVARARQLLRDEAIDAAVLDINLGDSTSYEVAAALQAANTPFVFLTGYNEALVQPQFAGAPVLVKPIHYRDLLAALNACGLRTGHA